MLQCGLVEVDDHFTDDRVGAALQLGRVRAHQVDGVLLVGIFAFHVEMRLVHFRLQELEVRPSLLDVEGGGGLGAGNQVDVLVRPRDARGWTTA